MSLFESIGQPLAVEPLSASTLLSLSHNSHVHNVVSLDMASTSVSDNIASVQELLKRLDVSDSEVSAGYGHSDVKAFEESRQLLNFGKWGSEETPDVVSFHFGSFETEDNASQSNSWNNMSGNDASMLSSQTWSNGGDLGLGGVAASTLFSNQQIKPMEQSSSDARFEHKATPPGLDSQIKPSVGAQSMAHTKAQNQVQSQMYSTATANHFQQAPPGIPLGATGRAIPTAPLTQGVIPQYYPPYDVSLNAQYTAPYNGNVGFSNNMSSLSSAVPSAVPITPAQTQAAPSSNQNSQSGIQPSQQQAQQIPQQQAFAPPPGMTAPYGFYPAPYFPNQAYYYSNQPNIGNYYGQNRNMYQNPRAAYQPDPYGGTGSVYQPDMYASTGQFDSSTYGAAPVHHSATPAGVTGNVPSTASNVPNGNANGNANANGSKQQKNNNSLPSGTGQVDNNNAYAYNNPYVVQARGSEQQAWSYPTVGQSWGNVNQGFSQTATPVGSVNNQQQAGSFSTSQPQSQPQHGQTNQPPRRW